MNAGGIHRAKADFSGSDVRDAIADAFTALRQADDSLTDKAVGRVLVKSGDQAECYRKGEAMMPADTLLRAMREWGAAFADPILALAGGRFCTDTSLPVDMRKAARITSAALLKIAAALENDGTVDDDEWVDARGEIIALGTLVDTMRFESRAALQRNGMK